MMFFKVKLVLFTSIISLIIIHVLGCEYNCEDKPVFTPSTLVVKYGEPASATCAACKDGCTSGKPKLEIALGDQERNGTTLTWRVSKMTEWDMEAMCYYTSETKVQCCSVLPVTVYQPPVVVWMRESNDTQLMFEHGEYTLECIVEDVAPVEKLKVTFYKGDTELAYLRSTTTSLKTPTTERFTLKINATKEDDGAHFWCNAELELETPQPLSSVASKTFTPIVYYGPYVTGSVNPDPIIITKGSTLSLNCNAEGNPTPFYTWTLPSRSPSLYNSSTFSVSSVGFEHGGQYVCNVTSNSKTVSVEFNVEVRVNIIPYVIAGAVLAVALLSCVILMGYIHYYKNNKMGGYDVKDVLHFRSWHVALPTQESK